MSRQDETPEVMITRLQAENQRLLERIENLTAERNLLLDIVRDSEKDAALPPSEPDKTAE